MASSKSIPSSYILQRTEPVPNLGGTYYDLLHKATGARHLHLECPTRDSWFNLMVRTPPEDSTGLPHIMEHSGGAGSRRFPPGGGGALYTHSILTDANASTSADFTQYYFAAPDRRDYVKFMSYIIDIVFFPFLAVDTFLRQRGHLELADPKDPNSKLKFTGVIFNEMKAVFASPGSHAYGALSSALFPGHPYSQNSGGDPAHVPDLTYEQYLEFHKRHFHPSNACFVSMGHFPLEEMLDLIETHALSEFSVGTSTPTPEINRFTEPVSVEVPFPASEADEKAGLGQMMLGWVTTPSADSYARLKLEVLAAALVESPASPLRQALDSSGLVGGLTHGMVMPYRASVFGMYLTHVDPSKSQEIESVVLKAMEDVEQSGLDRDLVESVITRIEFRLRERPRAWQNFLSGVTIPFLHGGDPWESINFEANLQRLQEEMKDAKPMETLIREQLLDNPHRARATLLPDAQMQERVATAERDRFAAIDPFVTDGIRAAIAEDVRRLEIPPPTPSPTTVPGFGEHHEVDPIFGEPTSSLEKLGKVAVELFSQPTNGITYVNLRLDLAGLPDELQDYLGIFSSSLTRIGKMPERIEAGTGGVSVRNHVQTDVTGQKCIQWLEIGGKALVRQQSELVSILADCLSEVSFEASQIKQTIQQGVSMLEQSVMGNAQMLLMGLAGSKVRRSLELENRTGGLGQLHFLKGLAEGSEAELEEVVRRLEAIRDHVVGTARLSVCVVCGEDDMQQVKSLIADAFSRIPEGTPAPAPELDKVDGPDVLHEARITQLPVAFNGEVFATPGADHHDTSALAVLAQLMRFGHLNQEVQRKGAAYGCDAQAFHEQGALWISSRRDPKIHETFAAIDEAIRQVADGEHEQDKLDAAVRPAFVPTLPPDSPDEASRVAWNGRFTGHTLDARNEFRRKLLAVSLKDLQRAAKSLEPGVRATLGGRAMIEKANQEHSLFDRVLEV